MVFRSTTNPAKLINQMEYWLIEDEPMAAAHLKRKIEQLRPDWTLTGTADSLQGIQELLDKAPLPNLVFCDIELSDGKSFIKLHDLPDHIPIIYVTAYHEHTEAAFQHAGVAYLHKPVSTKALDACFRRLFPDSSQLSIPKDAYQKTFLAKKGQKWFPIAIEQIQYFESDTYSIAVDAGGQKFFLTQTLKEIEEALDPAQFFRISRRHIVKKTSIKRIEPHLNHRLVIVLKDDTHLITSRNRTNGIKNWLNQ
jgi:DNA-binding LytR/AlgR family response regulator